MAATTCSINNDTVWSGNWTHVPKYLLDERVTLWSGIKRINMTHFNVNPIENECNGPPNSTFPPFVTIRLCHPNSTDITCRATNVYDKQTATCMCWTRFLFKDELGILIREVMVAFIFGSSSIVGFISTIIFTVNTFFRETKKKKKKETSVELEMTRICEVRSPWNACKNQFGETTDQKLPLLNSYFIWIFELVIYFDSQHRWFTTSYAISWTSQSIISHTHILVRT